MAEKKQINRIDTTINKQLIITTQHNMKCTRTIITRYLEARLMNLAIPLSMIY